ncbi:hypothetical protein NCCP2145_12240 [Pseudarthrobacter sp. NCCP-2145]|nr:hypothetical protein GCM10017547_14830 [Pseudarthrobacter oxydans]GKV71843.1 hypothetical protein NCCP2145_12240 [Pseudarthrobacter sp. NCCP-2145]
MGGKDVSGIRGDHAPRLPLQEGLPDFGFQAPELLGNPGGRVHMLFRRSGDRPELNDIKQQFKPPDVQHGSPPIEVFVTYPSPF